MEDTEKDNRQTARFLNSLLDTELASVDTYQRVLEKAETDPLYQQLRKIQEEHRETVRMLSAQIAELGLTPIERSESEQENGMSVLAEVSAGPATDVFSIKALKEREEETILNYENALKRAELDPELKEMIGSMLLPMARRHVPLLNQLLRAA